MSRARLNSVRRLIQKLDDEIYANAQGDNGLDVRKREDKYAAQLMKLLQKWQKETKNVGEMEAAYLWWWETAKAQPMPSYSKEQCKALLAWQAWQAAWTASKQGQIK